MAALAALLAVAIVPAAHALSSGALTVLTKTNDHRVVNGERALVASDDMNDVAQAWAEHMADTRDLEHNPNYSRQIPTGWSRAAENVAYNCGYSDAATKLVSQWINSTGHNTNMLNPAHTHIGVGVATDSSGCTWGVQVFAAYSAASAPPPSADLTVAPSLDVAAKPTITGTVKAGSTLKANPGSWTPSPATHSFQWLRDGKAISGATASGYKVSTTDRGKRIAVRVVARHTGFSTTSATSPSVTVPKAYTKAPTPKITGTARAGYTLKTSVGSWSPKPTAYGYQWYRNGTKITGATKYSYKLTRSDRGKKITVKVTGKRTGYSWVTRTSAHRTIAW